jgi:osmotically-inducible protein OsmY
MKARPIHVLGVVALGLAGACATRAAEGPKGPVAAGAATSDAAADPDGVPDAWIVSVLHRELSADPALAGQVVGVDAILGVVDLEGRVDAPLAKQRAVEIARVVNGVRAIVDRIEITTRPRPDYEVEFAVAAALSQDPVTAGQRVGARAREGVVTLSGDVGCEAERRIAEADVLSVPGVREVVDDLTVRPARDDARSAAAAARLLRDDPWIDDSRVRVEVARGTVRLSGSVGSAGEWARAERDAAQASPAGAVDASALRIDRWIDDGTLRGRPAVARSDGQLGQALVDALVRDPRVHPFLPKVDVHDGLVVLTGVAPSAEAARAAIDDARNLPGATAVRGQLNGMLVEPRRRGVTNRQP